MQFYLKSYLLVLPSSPLFCLANNIVQHKDYSPDRLLVVSIDCYAQELEVFTYHVPTKMAHASFTHALLARYAFCVLSLMHEVKVAMPSFLTAQQGMIILPLRTIFARANVHHMGRTLPGALWLLCGTEPLSPTSKSLVLKCTELKQGVRMLCLRVGSHRLASAFVEAVN